MNIFEKYLESHAEWCRLRDEIDLLVEKWIEEHVGFAGEGGDPNNIGKTNKGEYSWHISVSNEVIISYSVYKDKWLDYWDDEKTAWVEFDELLKYSK